MLFIKCIFIQLKNMGLAQEDVWTSYMSEDFHNRHTRTSSLATNSSRATSFTSHLIEGLLLNLLRPTGVLLDCRRLLLRLHRLGFVFGRFDRLVSLSFSHFRFHVPFGQDGFEGGTLDGPLEFHRSPGSLLGDFFLGTFLVFLSVQNGPRDFTRISLHEDRTLALLAQEVEQFPIDSDELFSMSRVDFVTTEVAQFELHPEIPC